MDGTKYRDAGKRLVVALGVAALIAALAVPVATAAGPKTKLVSQSTGGAQANGDSDLGDISANGRFVAFETYATNLDAADTDGDHDVYVRNMKSGKTKIVNISSSGVYADGNSHDPVISASGRFIAFRSDASNLIDGKVISNEQIYVRDRKTGKTEIVSVSNAGIPANEGAFDPDISAGGRWVVFQSKATNLTGKATNGDLQVYLHDRKKGKTILISKNNKGKAGTDDSRDPAVSPGGRVIVYKSDADNLVGADDNDVTQIYKYDRLTRKTFLVSKNKNGKAGNGDSDDAELSTRGKVIVFESKATNLIGSDTNGARDIYRRAGGKTTLVSRNWKGNLLTGSHDGAEDPDISINGRYLTFESDATNVTKGGANGAFDLTYWRNLKTGKVVIVSRTGGAIADARVNDPQISDDGKFVVVESEATNLLPGGDANGGLPDILRRGPLHH